MIDLRPDLLAIVQEILQRLVPACEIRAFGSRQKWTAKETSDLDLVVVGTQRLPLKTMAALKEAFEESILPMRVDILDWNAISEEFRRVIEAGFEVIQVGEASPLAPASSPAVVPEPGRRAVGSSATPLSGGARNAPTTRLDELCSLIVDCPHSTPVWTNSGKIVLRSQNIRNGKLDLSMKSFTDEAHFVSRNRRAKPQVNDLVITREAPMGEVCIIPKGLECCLGQRMVLLRPDSGKVDAIYLLFALQSLPVQHQIMWSEGTGSTVSNLRIPHLEALKIPTPPLPIQKAIAHILGTLDDRIELCRRMNETLEAMARALFKDWFIDFGPVRAKMEGREPPGLSPEIAALFPSKLVDSELSEIPEGWEVRRLDSFIELNYGKALKSTERVFGNVPVYGSGGITGFHSTPLVIQPSIIVGRKGTVGTLFWEERSFFPIDTVFYVSSSQAMSYCFYLLQTLGLETMNTDAAVPGLNRNNVYRLQIPFSGQEIRDEFSNILRYWRTSINQNLRATENLVTLRDTLLPKLLSGELSIPEAMLQVEAA